MRNDFCEVCGKPIKIYASEEKWKHHFCGRKCRFEFTKKKVEVLEKYAILYVNKYKYLIDLDDVDKVRDLNWTYISHKCPYARSTKGLLLHRLIMNCPEDMVVDHIDRNIFDNRKSNLRIVSRLINANNKTKSECNTKTGYEGITVDLRWKPKYKVRMQVNGKRIYFGQYPTLEQAIRVRDEVLKLKGQEIQKELERLEQNDRSK